MAFHGTDYHVLAEMRQMLSEDNPIRKRTYPHSSSSMRLIGVYSEGVTQKQVADYCYGTFGGRFEHFGGGTFEYIAYTD